MHEIETKIRNRLTALGYTRNVEVSVEFSQMSAGARADATLKVEGKLLGSEGYAQEHTVGVGALSEETVRENALLLLWDYFQGRSEASIHLALQDRYWVVDEAGPGQLQDFLNTRTTQGYVLYRALPSEGFQTLVFHVRNTEAYVLSDKA